MKYHQCKYRNSLLKKWGKNKYHCEKPSECIKEKCFLYRLRFHIMVDSKGRYYKRDKNKKWKLLRSK